MIRLLLDGERRGDREKEAGDRNASSGTRHVIWRRVANCGVQTVRERRFQLYAAGNKTARMFLPFCRYGGLGLWFKQDDELALGAPAKIRSMTIPQSLLLPAGMDTQLLLLLISTRSWSTGKSMVELAGML